MFKNLINCCWCGASISIDDARHSESLEGNFCSEGCVIACLKCHPYLVPFPKTAECQMGAQEPSPHQTGIEKDSEIQPDDFFHPKRFEGDWQ